MKTTNIQKIAKKEKEVQLLQLVQKKVRQIKERKGFQNDAHSLASLEKQLKNL